jgi:uncharacterized protein with ATP-grasp and redox domains
MDKECKECLINSFTSLLSEKISDKTVLTDLNNKIISYVSNIDSNIITPEVAREIHHLIYKSIPVDDLYKREKKMSNDIALSFYDRLKEMISKSDNPFDTALRLSIAGNIMDFAACPEFFSDSNSYLQDTVSKALSVNFTIDDSMVLKEQLAGSETLLYIGDNAGEIVFDRLFLETINHADVYYAVRDKPVLNDATKEDAYYTGINDVAKIISNGYDAPSTIIEKASEEFLAIYNKADLVISKGQGNFEGLMYNSREDLFFLLVVKCSIIADRIGVNKGDFIVMKNQKRK